MRKLVVANSELRSGVRLDFAYNFQVQQNRKLASSRYAWRKLDELTSDICDGPRQTSLVPEGIPYVRIGNLKAGDISSTDGVFVEGRAIKERFKLIPGDVLLSKTSDEPRAAIVTDWLAGATFSPDIFRLRVNPLVISPAWVSLFFNTRYATGVFRQCTYGTTIKRLRAADLKHIYIPVPPPELAAEIEALERQAQEHSSTAKSTFAAVISGLYGEIDARVEFEELPQQKWLSTRNIWLHNRWDVGYIRSQALAQDLLRSEIFRPISEVARVAVSSRKHLDPDQEVCYVNVSDIDAQYLTFSQVHRGKLKELSGRFRLPLQADQVLVLASGSNLGSEMHPVAIVEPELDGCLTSNAFIALEFAETPIYFGLVMRHPLVLAQLRGLASGSVIQMIKKQEIQDLLIPVLGSVWRQDFNDRARVAWEKRHLAIDLRQQAIQKIEAFIRGALED
jgi:hypothetical protein